METFHDKSNCAGTNVVPALDGFIRTVDYMQTDDYNSMQKEVTQCIEAFRNTLSEEQKLAFNLVLNKVSVSNARVTEYAYKLGIAQGICFRDEVAIK